MNLKEFQVVTWAIRQKMLCSKVREYLVKHPRATIIDIGCGLSTGFSEVDNGECKWVNLDLLDVIEIREKVLPCRDRERNIASDAFDLSWIDKLDVEVSEGVYARSGGVFYYFKPEKIKKLFCALANRLTGGGIYFDCESSYGAKKSNRMVKKTGNTGAIIYFAVDDAAEMFSVWSDKFKRITVVDDLPQKYLKAKRLPFATRLTLKMGCKMEIMKFVEITFE